MPYIIKNEERIKDFIHELNGMGVQISIDDFGTGYSSLSYLKQFPFDGLKIDRSFVKDIIQDPDAAAIARAVISLGRTLDLNVTAEGVETEAQLAFLRNENCDVFQGYLFNKPISAKKFENLLHKYN